MPDDELLEESGVPEEETSVSDDSNQEQEPSSESSATEYSTQVDDDVPDESEALEETSEESNEESSELIEEEDTDEEESSELETTTEEATETVTETETETESIEAFLLSDDFEEFVGSTVVVDRYQYAILESLEFIQYAHAIEIALLFLILFMRYKK